MLLMTSSPSLAWPPGVNLAKRGEDCFPEPRFTPSPSIQSCGAQCLCALFLFTSPRLYRFCAKSEPILQLCQTPLAISEDQIRQPVYVIPTVVELTIRLFLNLDFRLNSREGKLWGNKYKCVRRQSESFFLNFQNGWRWLGGGGGRAICGVGGGAPLQ